jgi:hypothetical protein
VPAPIIPIVLTRIGGSKMAAGREETGRRRRGS